MWPTPQHVVSTHARPGGRPCILGPVVHGQVGVRLWWGGLRADAAPGRRVSCSCVCASDVRPVVRACACECMCVGRHTGAEGPGLSRVGGWHVPAGCSPLSLSLFSPELRVGTFERHMVMPMLAGDDFTLLDGS